MPASFESTSWSTVLAAKDAGGVDSRTALDSLCRTYWEPIYVNLRHRGHGEEEAKDLTQAFFVHLLERDFLGNVDRGRGRFRSFLLVSLNRFLTDEWRRNHAQRRGGKHVLELDMVDAEHRYSLAAEQTGDAQVAFDQQWANAVLQTVLTRLRGEFTRVGKGERFEAFKDFLTAEADGASCRALGDQLGISESAVKVAVHRLRKRFALRIWQEIAKTVESPEEVEDELRYLLDVLNP